MLACWANGLDVLFEPAGRVAAGSFSAAVVLPTSSGILTPQQVVSFAAAKLAVSMAAVAVALLH
jgi:hypothetical protein